LETHYRHKFPTLLACVASLLAWPILANTSTSGDIAEDVYRSIRNGDTHVLKSAFTSGKSAELFGTYSQPIVKNAVLSNNVAAVQLLLDNGIDVNAVRFGFKNSTALHVAAEKGQLDMVKTLLANNANTQSLDKRGQLPLDYAILHFEPEVATLLLQNMNKLGSSNGSGEEQLMTAVFNKDPVMTRILLDNGATVSDEVLINTQCSRCHNMDGSPNHWYIPHLGGLDPEFLFSRMLEFAAPTQTSRHEHEFASLFTEPMLSQAANWYARQAAPVEAPVDQEPLK